MEIKNIDVIGAYYKTFFTCVTFFKMFHFYSAKARSIKFPYMVPHVFTIDIFPKCMFSKYYTNNMFFLYSL